MLLSALPAGAPTHYLRRSVMRRLCIAIALVSSLLVAAAPAAHAHPVPSDSPKKARGGAVTSQAAWPTATTRTWGRT